MKLVIACNVIINSVVASAGGHDSLQLSNIIDYVTIASTGNAVDFGDLI